MQVRVERPGATGSAWAQMRTEAEAAAGREPLLGSLLYDAVLQHDGLASALGYRFAMKLASAELGEQVLRALAHAAYGEEPGLTAAAVCDAWAVVERDPACHSILQPLLYMKGFQSLQSWRIANWLWQRGRTDMALFLQMRISEVYTVDIHPAARIGSGIMIDHAHAVVIGETASVGDNVSILHDVTLGGTGKEDGDRHPKIQDGVLIGAGAKVLGNITVGARSRIAAGSVVLADVPPCVTVAGVPARVVGPAGCDEPAASMNQSLG